MFLQIVWDVDPVLARLGPFSVRYYGICFGLALITGFGIWWVRARRFSLSQRAIEEFLWFTVPAVVVGGRLGHCFFYEPHTYLAHPFRVLAFWKGGLSSHGVALGLAAALWLYGRRQHLSWLFLGDVFAPAVALAVGWVRIGNFFNSEIFGSPASVPWAVVFTRHDSVPRHPAQLYDFLIGPATWLVLTAVERRRVRPIGSGLLAGTFLAVYFALRIFVERYKDFYVEQLRDVAAVRGIERWLGVSVHTGQLLSVLPVLLGVALVWHALRSSAVPAPFVSADGLETGRGSA